MNNDEKDVQQLGVHIPDEMGEQFAHDLDLFGLLQSLEWFLSEYPTRDEVAEAVADSSPEAYGPNDVLEILDALREDLEDRRVKPDINRDGDTASIDFGSGEAKMDLDAIEAAFEGSDFDPDYSE
jgi:hypothetical protein